MELIHTNFDKNTDKPMTELCFYNAALVALVKVVLLMHCTVLSISLSIVSVGSVVMPHFPSGFIIGVLSLCWDQRWVRVAKGLPVSLLLTPVLGPPFPPSTYEGMLCFSLLF